MKFSSLAFAGGIATAAAAPSSDIKRASACAGNSAGDRASWCDLSIDTNWYDQCPDTGNTVNYYFDVQENTLAPDGFPRWVQTINGQIPGPTIMANWGDTVQVHVTNSLNSAENGTGIHFHGIRQLNTNQNDGVVSVTECPIAPTYTTTYTWKACQYGSSWYHSHYGLQAWEGAFGGIIINGPATANYDVDKGNLFLTDWSHATADELYDGASTAGPPTLDNALINGTNTYGSGGERFSTGVQSGQSYRFRLVNSAVDTYFKFSIDNHTMTVISADLVPIVPYNTTMLNIAMGQRYDIIVTADQADVAENFWMRAYPQVACSENANVDNIRGILYYGNSPSTPTTNPYPYVDGCVDEDMSDLVPYLSLDAEEPNDTVNEDLTLGYASPSSNMFVWFLNGSTLDLEWGNPTLLQVDHGLKNWSSTSNIIELDEANEWAYLVMQTDVAVTHPIHLHGHDFYLLAQGTGEFDSSKINLKNPPRRDVASLYAGGYLAFGWKTDNPGVWLAHCHIGWHTEQGLAMQFVEQYSQIASTIQGTGLTDQCATWNAYMNKNHYVADDDGI